MIDNIDYSIRCMQSIPDYLRENLTASFRKTFAKIDNDIGYINKLVVDNDDFLRIANKDGMIIYYKNTFDNILDLLVVPEDFINVDKELKFHAFQNNFRQIKEIDDLVIKYSGLLENPSQIDMYIVDGCMLVSTVMIDNKIRFLKNKILDIQSKYGELNKSITTGIKLEKKLDEVAAYIRMLESNIYSFNYVVNKQRNFKLPDYI